MIIGYKDSVLGKIPNHWEVVKSSTVFELIHGYQFRDYDFTEKGLPIVKIGQINRNGEIDMTGCSFFSSERANEFIDKRIFNGDVLMALTGATLGKSCWVAGLTSPVYQNYRVGKFVPHDENILSKKFLYYVVGSALALDQIMSKINSGAQGNVGKSDFEKLKIPLPPLSEQQKIAEILSTVDNKIEIIDQQIIKTQELKKALMQRLLTKGIGHNEFKESPLGMIPKSWEVVKFGDTLSQSPEYGANASAKEYHSSSYRYIRITDILENGKLTTSNYVGISKEEGQQYELIENDILIARTGNTVGKSYHYFKKDGLCSFAGYLIRFRTDKQKLNPKYIFQFLHSDVFWNWVKSIVRTGAQPNINSKEYQSMLIPLPNILEQTKIAEILSSVDDKLEVLLEKKTHYQELKQGLMQQLLTGKIRVKV